MSAIEGGTTITITGRDLAVTYDNFTSNNVAVGDDPCMPIEDDFIPGKQISCTTIKGGSLGINLINITLPSGASVSNDSFRIVISKISRVDPILGPAAGGTQLTVWGSNLNTRLQISNRNSCQDYLDIVNVSVNVSELYRQSAWYIVSHCTFYISV